jgi:hypothetical protein
MKNLTYVFIALILVSGCASLQDRKVEPLTGDAEESMAGFSLKVSNIGTGMSPGEVRNILGEPDLIDKETDIHIKNQDTIWTYEHPVIACARFIVIFRNNGLELSSFAVKDVDGVSHYLTRDEFGK